MEYGLIGCKLKHSFSKDIHHLIDNYSYDLVELNEDELDQFLKAKDFKGINVTIPYKEKVIPYLSHVDESALKIGAINTIVNHDGHLYGYNTDYYGMLSLFEKAKINPKDKKVLILGSGGTSKTAKAVLSTLLAKEIITVSRNKDDEHITYEEMYLNHLDASIIVNTTPVGMYPNNDDAVIDLTKFNELEGVIDVIYNPLKTKLIIEAERLNIPCSGGLYMLVKQAIVASEYFFDKKIDQSKCDEIYKQVLSKKQNIVLTGMPGCGKSTIARLLSERLNYEYVDLDEYLVNKYQKDIPSIFKEEGEKSFRDKEREVIKEVSKRNGLIISTGGGAILRKENIDALKQNGKIYFIDRPLELLIPTDDRPLSKNKDDIKKRYEERYQIYLDTMDYHIINDKDIDSIIDEIERRK